MHRPGAFACFAFAVALALAAHVSLALGQIPAGRMSPPFGYAKDFALVKRADLFHVFYIQTGEGGGDFNYLGHQTSPDLYHWTAQPSVLVADRADWNPDFVWAPSIIERDGTWWMFYTGVRRRPQGSCPGDWYQQIGVATSQDLVDWTVEPQSWLDPLEVPWALQPKDSCVYEHFGNFRDPSVVWDPATNQWVMLYVTIPSPDSTAGNVPHAGTYDSSRYVVGMGRAPASFAGDADWTNLGALWITHSAYPNGTGMATWESPHAFSRIYQGQTLWFLVASAGPGNVVEGVRFLTGPSLTLSRFEKKGRSGWTWRGRIDNLQIADSYGHGNLTSGWFATEYMKDPETGVEYFANVNIPYLEFRRLRWRTTSDGFDLEPPFAVQTLDALPHSTYAGQPVDLVARAVSARDGAGPRTRGLEVVKVDAAGDPIGMLTPAQVGLPDSLTVADDETHVSWTPRLVDDSPQRVRVRLAAPDTDVQTPMVTIWDAPRGHTAESPGGSQGGRREPAPENKTTTLDALDVPGARPGLAFHLGAPGVARLTLFDLRGRRVRKLLDRALPSGHYRVAWDATDDAGARLPAGIYFARLETERGARTARVILLGR